MNGRGTRSTSAQQRLHLKFVASRRLTMIVNWRRRFPTAMLRLATLLLRLPICSPVALPCVVSQQGESSSRECLVRRLVGVLAADVAGYTSFH
jgi:hypothetical protein